MKFFIYLILLLNMGICNLTYAKDSLEKKKPLINQLVGESFDNSIPGKWNLELITKSVTDSNMNSVKVLERCITKEDIEKSKRMNLVEKFNTGNGLSCVSDFKRINKENGIFNMLCLSKDEKKNPIELKVNGTLMSQEKNSALKMDYSLKIRGKAEQFFTMETKSTFVSGSCSMKK
jgi:hypothetical protein